jgi:hypothetical protein
MDSPHHNLKIETILLKNLQNKRHKSSSSSPNTSLLLYAFVHIGPQKQHQIVSNVCILKITNGLYNAA